MTRYDRQIRVGKVGLTGQEKLQDSRLLIVGCGALGTYTAEQLVRGGVGELLLVDPDTVSFTNLQRQTLFTEADAHTKRLKVAAAKDALLAINSQVTITALPMSFDELLVKDLGHLDLVLDCTDNFLVRSAINTFCLHYQLPFIFAACAGTTGQVMALHPAKGPCLNCVFPQMAELAEKSCETIGVITPLIPLVSSLQVGQAYRYLLEPESLDWQQLLVADVWQGQVQTFQITKNPACPLCAKQQSVALPQLKKVCGHVFQGQLPAPIDLAVIAHHLAAIEEKALQNKLALRVVLTKKGPHLSAEPQPNVTIFKTGRTLFYDFPDLATATKMFDWLLTTNTALEENL